MLCRFRDVDDRENFYLHYPWFFSSEIIDRLLKGTPREEIHRSALEPLANTSQDQYIRTVMDGSWNWRDVKERVSYVIDLQITRAEYSQSFYGLFQTLQEQRRTWLEFQKKSNTQVDGSKMNLPLHFEKLSPAELWAATEIFRRHCTAQEEDWKTGRRGFMVGKVSDRLKYLHQIVTKVQVRCHYSQQKSSNDDTRILQLPNQDFPILEEVSKLLQKGKELYGHDLVSHPMSTPPEN